MYDSVYQLAPLDIWSKVISYIPWHKRPSLELVSKDFREICYYIYRSYYFDGSKASVFIIIQSGRDDDIIIEDKYVVLKVKQIFWHPSTGEWSNIFKDKVLNRTLDYKLLNKLEKIPFKKIINKFGTDKKLCHEYDKTDYMLPFSLIKELSYKCKVYFGNTLSFNSLPNTRYFKFIDDKFYPVNWTLEPNNQISHLDLTNINVKCPRLITLIKSGIPTLKILELGRNVCTLNITTSEFMSHGYLCDYYLRHINHDIPNAFTGSHFDLVLWHLNNSINQRSRRIYVRIHTLPSSSLEMIPISLQKEFLKGDNIVRQWRNIIVSSKFISK